MSAGTAGVPAALSRVKAACTIASVDTDRLYRLGCPTTCTTSADVGAGAHPLAVRPHDGFLIEDDQVGGIIRAALASQSGSMGVTTS